MQLWVQLAHAGHAIEDVQRTDVLLRDSATLLPGWLLVLGMLLGLLCCAARRHARWVLPLVLVLVLVLVLHRGLAAAGLKRLPGWLAHGVAAGCGLVVLRVCCACSHVVWLLEVLLSLLAGPAGWAS
jgi:hypothetical protein